MIFCLNENFWLISTAMKLLCCSHLNQRVYSLKSVTNLTCSYCKSCTQHILIDLQNCSGFDNSFLIKLHKSSLHSCGFSKSLFSTEPATNTHVLQFSDGPHVFGFPPMIIRAPAVVSSRAKNKSVNILLLSTQLKESLIKTL